MKLAEEFFTKDERKQVTTAVHRAEQQTSGEIVPMIVSRSHHYPLATLYGALLISFPLSLLIVTCLSDLLWLPPNNLWIFLGCLVPLFLISLITVKNTLPLQRIFISPSRAKEEVEEEAMKAFYTEKLYKTRCENGILLFISVFERRVCILGDAGINTLISQEIWDEIVARVTLGIKNKNQCKSLCDAIESVGNILKEHFPIKEDDSNELHDLIIRQSSLP